MRATTFLRNFMRVQLGPESAKAAEVKFRLKDVEVAVDLVEVEIGDPVVFTVALTNDPTTPGHVLTQAEAEAAFRLRPGEGP